MQVVVGMVIGESQKIERILTEFSKQYVATSGDTRLNNADAVMVCVQQLVFLAMAL